MGDLRKDYVLEKFVVVPSTDQKPGEHEPTGSKCAYCPGNESMTQPALLALVVKDGMLQRLSDSDDAVVEDWSVRVFESSNPIVATGPTANYSEKPLYSEPAYGYHQII